MAAEDERVGAKPHLGSTSAALDKQTGELVERATYQAYGARESDYRPGRWGEFREDYGFTGKEEDVEVGLVVFGKRFYAPALQRWVSADPLEVHEAGSGEPNVYAYVSGQALRGVDPLGLECGDNQSCGSSQYYAEWSQRWSDEQNSANAEVRTLEEKFKNQDSAAFAENKNKFDAGARGALGSEYEAAADRLDAANAALSVADEVRSWVEARVDANGEQVTPRQIDEQAAALANSMGIFQSYIAPLILGFVGASAMEPTPAGAARIEAGEAAATPEAENSIPQVRFNRQRDYGGSQTNSPAAKAARAAGEGKLCPTCGKPMLSGTKTAPSPQHEPTLWEHYTHNGGHAMTDAERRAYAKGPGIKGAQCITCQRREGAATAKKSREFNKEHGL